MAMQVPTEEEILAGAIAGTEQEIFDEATGQEEAENNGDRSLEEMDDDIPGESEEGDEPDEEEPDGEAEDDETEEEIDAASEEDGEEPEPTQSEDRGRIPSSRLREETERRRAVESELANARAQIAAIQVSQQQRQQPQQEQPAKPDMWSDPEAWAADREAQLEQRVVARYVESSLVRAQKAHGEEFSAAYKAATSLNTGDPQARALIQSIYNSPDPGEALMEWHEGLSITQAIRAAGGPAAYREKLRQEIMSDPETRRQTIDGARREAERGDGGRPRTITRLPKSLNGASGGGSVRNADPELYNDSDASAFAFAMK